jgi:hypothetical protein
MLKVANNRVLCVSAMLAGLFAAGVSQTFAGYATWTGAVSSDWSTVGNWNADPAGAYLIIFEGPNLPVALSSAIAADTVDIGTWTGSSTGSSIAVANGANLTVNNSVLVGTAGPGSASQTGGTVNVSGYLKVGVLGVGAYTQTGGTVNANGGFTLTDGTTAAGSSYSISGGNLNIGKAATHAIGQRGAATMNVSGTAVVTVDGYTGGLLGLDIGGHLSGGVPLPDSTGTSSLNQTGGTVNLTSDLPCLRLGVGSATTGIYNLDGGTLNLATNVENWNGTGHLNINGGTLNFTGGTINVDYLDVGTKDGATGQFALKAGQAMLTHILTLGSSTSTGALDVLGGTATVDDLVFGGVTSRLRLGDGQAFNVLQSNYSVADGLTDISAGFVAASASGSGVQVGSVDIGGVAYTQFLGVAVPEPSTVALLASVVFGLLVYAWRKRKQ